MLDKVFFKQLMHLDEKYKFIVTVTALQQK